MKIASLKIENFLTIDTATLVLSDKGLCLVQGENLDDDSANSNGAGKSSLPDALFWCLYGQTARGVSGDAVVNHKRGKDCAVEALIEADDGLYRVMRYRKHKEHKNRLIMLRQSAAGAPWEDLTLGTDKLTQEAVSRLLGASVEVFQAAVYAGQDAMPDLPAMTDKQLKVLVEEGAGIDRLQRAYEVARSRAADASHEFDKAVLAKKAHEEAVARSKEQIEDLERQSKEWHARQAERIKEKTEHAKAGLETAKIAATAVASLPGERERLQGELKRMDDALAGLSGEKVELDRLIKGEKAFERRLMELRAEGNAENTKLKRLREELDRIEGRVGQLCGECGKPYGEHDLDAARKIAEERLAAQTSAVRHLAELLANAKTVYEEAHAETQAFAKSMTDASETTIRHRALVEAIADIDKKLAGAEQAKRLAAEVVEQVKALKAESNPYTKLISDWEARLKRLEDSPISLDDFEEKLMLAQDAVEVFGPAGVRAHILDTVTPFLNERTAHYLGTLSDGNISAVWSTLALTAKGEYREKFNIEVKNGKGAESYAGLSGGEKRKVRLATALALQDLVASRAAKPIGLWIGDEVDHALDEAGLERLMTILDEKAKERGTVLVISHNSLTDWVREVCLVTKKDGLSKITGACTA